MCLWGCKWLSTQYSMIYCGSFTRYLSVNLNFFGTLSFALNKISSNFLQGYFLRIAKLHELSYLLKIRDGSVLVFRRLLHQMKNISLIIFHLLLTEAATRGVLYKKVFSEISQYSQENTCTRVSFLILF